MAANIDARMREYLYDHGIKIDKDGMIVVTKQQFARERFKHRSLRNPDAMAWMIPSTNGCCLILEGKHFRII